MNPIDKSFKANSDPLIGNDSPFSIDRLSTSGPVSYLRDKNHNLVGFTYKGKHVFLGNVQKDKSGALFPAAQYKVTAQDMEKLIHMYFTYLEMAGKDNFSSIRYPFFKNGKHIFAQVKDDDKDKFKNKHENMYEYEVGRTFKFKELHPFVDLPKTESKPKSISPDSIDVLFDLEEDKALEEARAKETTEKPSIKNKKLDLEKSQPKKESKQKSIASDKMDALTFDALFDLEEAKAMAEVETREPRIKNKKLDLEKSKSKTGSKQKYIYNEKMQSPTEEAKTMTEVETEKSRIKNKKLDLEKSRSTMKAKKSRIKNKINIFKNSESDTEELIPKNKSRNKKTEK